MVKGYLKERHMENGKILKEGSGNIFLTT